MTAKILDLTAKLKEKRYKALHAHIDSSEPIKPIYRGIDWAQPSDLNKFTSDLNLDLQLREAAKKFNENVKKPTFNVPLYKLLTLCTIDITKD